MGTIDIRSLESDQIVIHYGGALTSVDAYTFANSLVAFADTVRSVNSAINPEQGIEVRLEAVGPGSFRAVLKRIPKGIGGFFSRGVQSVFWAIVTTLIINKTIENDPSIIVNVGTDQVVIERGDDRIIIPREAYDKALELKTNPEIQEPLSRTFQIIEEDDAIEHFGLTPNLDDTEPLVQIRRDQFPQLSVREDLVPSDPSRRIREEKARLIVLKLWLKEGLRKWTFEWNGVPISAPIKDAEFLGKLIRREILIGARDALDVVLRYEQEFDPKLDVYVNDANTFEIIKVSKTVSSGGGQKTIADE